MLRALGSALVRGVAFPHAARRVSVAPGRTCVYLGRVCAWRTVLSSAVGSDGSKVEDGSSDESKVEDSDSAGVEVEEGTGGRQGDSERRIEHGVGKNRPVPRGPYLKLRSNEFVEEFVARFEEEQAQKFTAKRKVYRVSKEEEELLFEKIKDSEEAQLEDVKALCKSLALKGKIEKFPELIELLFKLEYEHMPEVFFSFMRACVAAGAPAEILSVFNDFKSRKLTPTHKIIEIMLFVLGSVQDEEGIGVVLEYATKHGLSFDGDARNALLEAYEKSGGVARCIEALATWAEDGFAWNAETYRIMVAAHLRENNLDEGLRLKKEAEAEGVRIENAVYTALVKYYSYMEEFDKVDETVQELQGLDRTIPPSFYTTVMAAHARLGNVTKAIDMFYQMQQMNLHLTAQNLNVMLGTIAQTGNMWLLNSLYLTMRSNKLPMDSFTFATLISKFSRHRHFAYAYGAFLDMKEMNLQDDACYNAMINAFCDQRVPNFPDAIALLSEMARKGHPPTQVAYASIIHHAGRVGDADLALEIFRRIPKDIELDVVTYSSMIRALGRSGRHEAAVAMFERMKRKGVEPNVISYANVISVTAKALDMTTARHYEREMYLKDLTPSVRTYGALLLGEVRLANVDRMVETYKKMLELGVEPDETIFDILLGGFMEAYQMDEVLMLLKDMRQRGFRPNDRKLLGLLKRFAGLGDIPKVIKILDEVLRRELHLSNAIKQAMDLISYELQKNTELRAQVEERLRAIQQIPPRWYSEQANGRQARRQP